MSPSRPTTMTKEQFEAHVRAEAMREHPDETPGVICIGDIHAASKRSAYIAARMEHDWPLVELLWRFVEITKPHNGAWCNTIDRLPIRLKFDAREYDRLHDAHVEATTALSPYTTKQIEQ